MAAVANSHMEEPAQENTFICLIFHWNLLNYCRIIFSGLQNEPNAYSLRPRLKSRHLMYVRIADLHLVHEYFVYVVKNIVFHVFFWFFIMILSEYFFLIFIFMASAVDKTVSQKGICTSFQRKRILKRRIEDLANCLLSCPFSFY